MEQDGRSRRFEKLFSNVYEKVDRSLFLPSMSMHELCIYLTKNKALHCGLNNVY